MRSTLKPYIPPRRRRRLAEPGEMVTIIVDPSDARKDKQMRKEEARKLFVKGKLDFDVTNGTYCMPRRK